MPRYARLSTQQTDTRQETEAHRIGRWFTRARRTGLIATLSATEWHTLCAILSFTNRRSERHFMLDQLALALGVPRAEAEARLQALSDRQWNGEPLASIAGTGTEEALDVRLAPVELFERTPDPAERDEPRPLAHERAGLSPDRTALVRALEEVGLHPVQIERLLSEYPVARIRRQLGWLEYRKPQNPAALLIRAVEGDWQPPKGAV